MRSATSSNIAGAAQREALKYILKLGVDNILAHARPMCDKLIEELPKLGYPCITPRAAHARHGFPRREPRRNQRQTESRQSRAKVKWKQMRVSPSVFNTMADVDQLLDALS